MSKITPSYADEFVNSLKPLLHRQDLGGIVHLLNARWSLEQITDLFVSEDSDARKVSALAFGLVGGKSDIEKLVPLLKDPDSVVAQFAEHSMWSVWFRCGTPEANHQVSRGTRALSRGDYDNAIEHFTRAIELDPDFAEAYNQRAIAKFLLERFDECVDDYRKTVELMPFHFGALAGLGHCHAHNGRLVPALECYEKAIAFNPHLEDVRKMVEELREQLRIDRDERYEEEPAGQLANVQGERSSELLAVAAVADSSKSIDVFIDPGRASVETLQAVLESISDLHLAAGGMGFEFHVEEHSAVLTGEAMT